MSEIDVAVWGHSGFAGQELVEILQSHPNVDNIRRVGREMPDDLDSTEVAFLALPHGPSGEAAGKLAVAGHVVIDLSGDLRFPRPEDYSKWYGQSHSAPELLPVPYALPELYGDCIAGNQVVSMPGCYPTATLLGSVPLIENGLIKPDSTLVVNAISGVSGRGKQPTELTHFMTMSGNAITYNTGRVHRHVGEIEQFLDGRTIFFSPMVIPIERGMLVQTTAELQDNVDIDEVIETFEEAYSDEPLVKVLSYDEKGNLPDIHDSVRTDGCYIGFVVSRNTIHIVSSIDNLRKGAASQAVQVFNILNDLPELTGLRALK